MCEPGNIARLRQSQRPQSVNDLDEKPEPQHVDRGYPEAFNNNKEPEEQLDFCPGIANQISPQDAGYSSAGPDDRNIRGGMNDDLDKSGHESAEQIEEEKFSVSQCDFDIIAEYPEIEHVTGQV